MTYLRGPASTFLFRCTCVLVFTYPHPCHPTDAICLTSRLFPASTLDQPSLKRWVPISPIFHPQIPTSLSFISLSSFFSFSPRHSYVLARSRLSLASWYVWLGDSDSPQQWGSLPAVMSVTPSARCSWGMAPVLMRAPARDPDAFRLDFPGLVDNGGALLPWSAPLVELLRAKGVRGAVADLDTFFIVV